MASEQYSRNLKKRLQPLSSSDGRFVVLSRQRISGTSGFFFELSDGTNSTIGSYQIDSVNFRPNRATE